MHQINDHELVELGRRAFAEESWGKSITVHHELTHRNPNVPAHWMRLGRSFICNNQPERAILPLRKAVALREESFATWLFLANAYAESSRLRRARVCAEKSLELKPTRAGFELLISIHLFAGDPALASACAREAAERSCDTARSELTHALALLTLGDFKRGWERYERRHEVVPTNWEQFQAERWQGEDLNEKTLVILSEQGIGDAIQFARYGRILRNRYSKAKLWFFGRTGLRKLLQTAPDIDRVFGNETVPPPCDFYVPAMSLPRLLEEWKDSDTSVSSCSSQPYLRADHSKTRHWSKWFDQNAPANSNRIGLVWRGNKNHRGDRFRSFPAFEFRRLGIWGNASFYSLQHDAGEDELEELQPWIDLKTFPALDEKAIFEDSAAILKQLDLLITVDTAMAHLAGALGTPTWLILGRGGDFRWSTEVTDSVLYPTMRIFRQGRIGQWGPVIDQAASALGEQFAKLRPRETKSYIRTRSGTQVTVAARHGFVTLPENDIFVGGSIKQLGEWSEAEPELLCQLLEPDCVVVEAGSNVGSHTLPIAKEVGSLGHVHAFEPQAVLHRCLCSTVALNGISNVTCHAKALGATPGIVSYPEPLEDEQFDFSGQSMLAEGEELPPLWSMRANRATAEQTTIDHLGLRRCDLIKSDTPGNELAVLLGAENTIRKHQPILYIQNQSKFQTMQNWLAERKYTIFWHQPAIYRSDNFFRVSENSFGDAYSSNMLCVPESKTGAIDGLTVQKP